MAALIIITVVLTFVGSAFGAYLTISFAIRREDRSSGSLRFSAATHNTKAARSLVGISSSRWDQV
jgi:hypothetical protein